MTRDVFIREIRQSESMLYHVAKSILKNDSDCADAVQETLLKAYEKLHTLKQDQFLIIPAPFEPPVRSLRATLPAHQSHTFR